MNKNIFAKKQKIFKKPHKTVLFRFITAKYSFA